MDSQVQRNQPTAGCVVGCEALSAAVKGPLGHGLPGTLCARETGFSGATGVRGLSALKHDF